MGNDDDDLDDEALYGSSSALAKRESGAASGEDSIANAQRFSLKVREERISLSPSATTVP